MKSKPTQLFGIQALLTILLYFVWAEDSAHQAGVFVVFGSLISAAQIGLLYFVWWRVFTKKKIAPSVIAVVIKYALLGLAFWYLFPLRTEEIKALAVGIMTNPIAIVLFAILKNRTKKETVRE